MENKPIDPSTHRLIQTRDGVETIPKSQPGVPVSEYFRNAELPHDLARMVVFSTANGPILGKPDPVAWSAEHTEQAKDYAGRLKTLIDEKGYYRRTLGLYADRLAEQTGHPREEVKAAIAGAFEQENGKDPFSYLQDARRAQGLPVRDEPEVAKSPSPEQGA